MSEHTPSKSELAIYNRPDIDKRGWMCSKNEVNNFAKIIKQLNKRSDLKFPIKLIKYSIGRHILYLCTKSWVTYNLQMTFLPSTKHKHNSKSLVESAYFIEFKDIFVVKNETDVYLKQEYQKFLITAYNLYEESIKNGVTNISAILETTRDEDLSDELKQQKEEIFKEIGNGKDDITTFSVSMNATLEDYYDILCEHGNQFYIHFNFKEFLDEENTLDINCSNVQVMKINIINNNGLFVDHARYKYHCRDCRRDQIVNLTEVASTNGKWKCIGEVPKNDGNGMKPCGTLLTPIPSEGLINIYAHNSAYRNPNGKVDNCIVESLTPLISGTYLIAGVVTRNEDGHVVIKTLAHKKTSSNKINIKRFAPDGVLQPRDKDNPIDLVPEFIKSIDGEIKRLTNDDIIGMNMPKLMFIIQKFISIGPFDNTFNIMLSGTNGVGKNYVSELYCQLFYGGEFKKTDGSSISVPAMRGTSASNSSSKRLGNTNRMGIYGLHKCVLIDEASENEPLMDSLKPTLLAKTFSNDTATGDGMSYFKTAQVNILENPQMKHLRDYAYKVRKEYIALKEIADASDENETTNNVALPFNVEWDVRQHLFFYKNIPTLYMAIKNTRINYESEGKDWYDGRQLATKDRFLANAMLDRKGDFSNRISSVIDKHSQCGKFQTVQEFEDTMKLAVENIDEVFLLYKDFFETAQPFTTLERNRFMDLIKKYGFEPTDRLVKTGLLFMHVARILNHKNGFGNVEFKYLEYFLYMKGRIVYIEELDNLDFPQITHFQQLSHDGKEIIDVPYEQFNNTPVIEFEKKQQNINTMKESFKGLDDDEFGDGM